MTGLLTPIQAALDLPPPLRAKAPEDQELVEEQTAWGPAHRLLAPVAIRGTPLQWDLPAGELGAHRPQW